MPDDPKLVAALAHLRAGRPAAALPLFAALASGPHAAAGHRGQGHALRALGRRPEALAAFRAGVAAAPDDILLRDDLAEALVAEGDRAAALAEYAAIAKLAPDQARPHLRMAAIHAALNRPDRAVAAFEAAIARGDRSGSTLNDLGNALNAMGRPMAAIARFEAARALLPGETAIAMNLANALQLAGRAEAARLEVAAVLDTPGRRAEVRHAQLLGLHYQPELTPEALVAAHAAYGAEATAAAGDPPRPPRRAPDGRLRIGLVSADFHTHSVAYFLEPLLANHDRTGFAITAYANQRFRDATTARLAAQVESFVEVAGLDDAALAARIRADGIDILIDLSGHTAGNRLGVFARRPAPVQAGWLGYPCTTGLPAMDWLIADSIAAPPHEAPLGPERIARLVGCYLCFSPPEPAPARVPAPMLAGAPARFLAICNLAKLHDRVLASWARILAALPGATLTLRTRVLEEAETAAALRGRFAALGGDTTRLVLAGRLPREAHLAELPSYDLMLDPFPYPGVTMTAEALWAGLPVLAMRGRFGPLSHSGESLLTAVGLADAIAADAEDYVARAIALGRDASAMQALRARIDTGALTDGAGFARRFEALLHAMWMAPDARMGKAQALLRARRHDEALPLFEALAAEGLEGAGALRGAGRCLRGLGRLVEAEAAFRRAVALAPDDRHARQDLGEILIEAGKLRDALAAYQEVDRLAPQDPLPQRRIALIHDRLQQGEGAVAAFRAAIARGDTRAGTLNDLGNALAGSGQPTAACAAFEEALQKPDAGWMIRANFANALNLAGRAEDGAAEAARVVADPAAPLAVRHIQLLGLHYLPGLTPAAYVAAHRDYGARATAAAGDPPRPPRRDGDGRLRIGYVSADFRAHPVSYFLEGVLAAHDRDAFVLHAYAQQHIADETTRRMRPHLDQFVSTTRLDDAALAARIRADGIDILVDLSGHTAGTRLGVFAHRPAAVQANWLGYAGSSGLPAMDWVVADAIVLPPEDEALYTERPMRLPGCYLTFRPPELAVARGPAPLTAGGAARFGCFANLAKLNDGVLRAWARILEALPGATLALRTRALGEAATATALRARFAQAGGDPARLETGGIIGRASYFAEYAGLDLMLDPFPFPGGTTTAEALWAGVPVLAMRGRFGMMSRNGETLLTCAGIPEAIAADADAYVAKAVALGRDAAAMQALRTRIDTRRLTDAAGFTRGLEAAYHRMWAETPQA